MFRSWVDLQAKSIISIHIYTYHSGNDIYNSTRHKGSNTWDEEYKDIGEFMHNLGTCIELGWTEIDAPPICWTDSERVLALRT